MKNRFKSLIVAALALAGCATDESPVVPNDGEGGEGTVRLELFTSSPEYGLPQGQTRMGVAQENLVDAEPWVLVFRGSGAGALYFEAAKAYTMAGKRFVNLTATTQPSRLLILANTQSGFTTSADIDQVYDFTVENLNAQLANKTLVQASTILQTMPLTATTHPSIPFAGTTPETQQPLPMSGVWDATAGIGKNMSVGTVAAPFELTRAVAKVVITNSDPNFKLLAATVIQTPRRGTLFDLDSTPQSVAAADRTDYFYGPGNLILMATATENSTAANPIYIYESSKSDDVETRVVIAGHLDGETGNDYMLYVLSFQDLAATAENPNATLDILRNKIYTFDIRKVNRRGFSHYTSAFEATHASNEDIVWGVDVKDATAHDMVDNGEYYLGVSNTKYIVYGNGALSYKSAFTVTTNCVASVQPRNMEVLSGEGLIIVGSMDTGLLTPVPINLAPDASTPGVTEVRVDLSPTFTSGVIRLRIGDLTKDVYVERRPALAGVDPAAPNHPVAASLSFTGDYLSAEIEGTNRWITLSTDGVRHDGNYLNALDGGEVHILLDRLYNDYTTTRSAVVYLSRMDDSEGRIKLDITQNRALWGGENHFLYFDDATGTMQVGRWGGWRNDKSEEWDTKYGVKVVNDINQIGVFKLGGVIGMDGIGTVDGEMTAIRFNPSDLTTGPSGDITGYGNQAVGLPSIPAFSAGDYAAGIRDISSPAYHNGANVRAGKGDACKLAGFRVGIDNPDTYDSGWRMPTRQENVYLFGAPDVAYNNIGNTTGYTIGTGTAANTVNVYDSTAKGFWLPAIQGPEPNRGGMVFPILWTRDRADGTPRNFSNESWSSTTTYSGNAGYSMQLSLLTGFLYPNGGYTALSSSYGYAIRCVREEAKW